MGKSVSTPPVPDYMGLAKQQGQENLKAAETTSRLSNPNMITPFGTQTITYSNPTFDEARYNADLANYQQKTKNINRNAFYQTGGGSGDGGTEYTYFDDAAYQKALKDAGAAPDRNAYLGPSIPTVTQQLTPTAQATLEAQQRVQQRLAELGGTAMDNVQATLSTPFVPTSTEIKKDFGGYGDVPDAADYMAKTEVPLQYSIDTSGAAAMPINAGTTAQELILQRLNPTLQAGDVSFRQQLANQGLTPGTEAYDKAFRNREMSKNDLYNQAALQGINLDMAARQQTVNELLGLGNFANQAQLAGAGLYNSAMGQNFGQGITGQSLGYNQALGKAQFQNTAQQQQLAQDLALRSQPLQELAAIMGGSQIQLPQFSGYQPVNVAASPTFNAGQAQYQGQLAQANAQNAANSQLTQGLFQLGGAALLAPTGTFGGAAGLFSDRRLKTNIKQIGVANNGLNIYSYNYVWGGPTQLGYMADEVEKIAPQAVGESQGFKTVNYGMI
jgi:hypothetical protein